MNKKIASPKPGEMASLIINTMIIVANGMFLILWSPLRILPNEQSSPRLLDRLLQ